MKKIFTLIIVFFSLMTQAQTPIFDTITITGSRQYLGKVDKAILEIKFADNNATSTIQKPLIVVEGFDCGLLGVENEYGEADLQQFIDSYQFMISNLEDELSAYDIIYINFKNGKDYMQRNAYLVEDIIKWVNHEKAVAGSTVSNVVLGQSMGGIIARYALKDMEDQYDTTFVGTWRHDTRLYVSPDAPHQGANIPLSIQALVTHLADQFVGTPIGDFNINMGGDGGEVM